MEVHESSNRRKSGRARQAPVLLSQDPSLLANSTNGAKRKRIELRGGDASVPGDEEESEEESEDDDSDPDEEELKERRTKTSKKGRRSLRPKDQRWAALLQRN